MAIDQEVIDLTADSPPKVSRILRIEACTSAKKIQFKIKKSSQNPSPSPRHSSSKHTFDFYEFSGNQLQPHQAHTLVQLQTQAQASASRVIAPKPAWSTNPEEHQESGRGIRWMSKNGSRAQKLERYGNGSSLCRHMAPSPSPATTTLGLNYNKMGPPPTLMLFPHHNTTHVSHKTTSVAPNMPSSDHHQLDLELRLG